jgi:protocatechuate 3,4-dioxygenase beta subunit
VLEALDDGTAEPLSVRANAAGSFEFPSVPSGAYLVNASRRGFATVQYGQKRWKSAGAAITLDDSGPKFITMRLPRLGAISGTIFDENEVGLPEHDVVAYRTGRPPQLVARARTDDRGRYRLSGLDPGKYLVRTVAKEYEEGGYLPTYYPQGQRGEQAYAVETDLDQETPEINVHPAPGRLVAVSGQVNPPAGVSVSLVSERGAETTVADASGNFRFGATAPGPYEIYAQGPADARAGLQAGYQSILLDRDRSDIRLALRPLPQIQFVIKDTRGANVDLRSVWVMARRKDLAGIGRTQALPLTGDLLAFLPGHWEVALAPPAGSYVSAISNARGAEPSRVNGWREFVLTAATETMQAVLSSTPGAVHGRVVGAGNASAAGAPVYLEAYDPVSRRRLRDPQVTRSDAAGQYRFPDLAPGTYRLLSSADLEPQDGSFETRARTVRVEESRQTEQDLEFADVR